MSRHTVRAALRQLRADGTVVAERGRGSRLAAEPAVIQPLGTLYSLFRSVEGTGLEQRSIVRVLDERKDGVMAARLGFEESTPLVHLERLRLAGDEPIAIDRVWLPAAISRPLLTADFSRTSLYDELAKRCHIRITGGHERITATLPDPVEQALLASPESNPAALRIDRLGYALGQPVEWRTTLVRGDRFGMSVNWSPTQDFDFGVDALLQHQRSAPV